MQLLIKIICHLLDTERVEPEITNKKKRPIIINYKTMLQAFCITKPELLFVYAKKIDKIKSPKDITKFLVDFDQFLFHPK